MEIIRIKIIPTLPILPTTGLTMAMVTAIITVTTVGAGQHIRIRYIDTYNNNTPAQSDCVGLFFAKNGTIPILGACSFKYTIQMV